MKISIRDDDLCFYSNYQDFKKIYDDLNIPVSISLVPFSVPYHGNVKPFGDGYEYKQSDFRNNKTLVESLKKDLKDNKIEILLHGFSHEYKTGKKMIPELIWKSKSQIEEELSLGKKVIEETFKTPIKVFVAPSNEINRKGISVIERLGLNFSGCFHGFTRKLDFYYLNNLIKRYISRILYGVPLGGLMKFKHHNELSTIGIQDYKKLIKYYEICKRKNWDYCLVVHYWQLNNNPEMLYNFKKIISYIKSDKGQFAFVSECLK